MKKLFNYIFISLMGCATLTSCLDDALETSPTDSMSGDGLLNNAQNALIPLNGIYRSMYATWSPTANQDQSFGISSYILTAEVMGEDFIMKSQGNGWFWYDCLYQVKSFYTGSAFRSYDTWNAYYTWIANANYILDAQDTMEGAEADKNYVLGQAYAIRAYSYFMLAQTFARTYKGHEQEPCCPIYTEPTKAGTQGAPRSTVAKVYEQIDSDLTNALNMLKGTTRKHISHMGYEVALGLQARVALVKEDWSTAATAAATAIQASGCSILPVADFMGLNDSSKANVMWGSEIITDQAGGYASFFAHMDPDNAYGDGARKQISKELYNQIGEEDTRRAWWNPNDEKNESFGYQQTKFEFKDVAAWTGDYIWMRVEEMYLIAAEAYCRMGGEENEKTAREYLDDLMAERDEHFSAEGLTGTEIGDLTTTYTNSLLDEILLQRRIELWGEAGRVFDIRRLKQGFQRTEEMGWPKDALLSNRPTTDPENYMWVLTIPQSEFDGNINMDPEKDQNPLDDK